MQSPLVSPEAVCRFMVERDAQQHSGEQQELPAASLNDSMSSTVSAILSPRVRTGHGVALRGLSKSLEHRSLRAGFDAELDRTCTLTARHIEKRDTRTALRLFKKDKDKVKPKSLTAAENDEGNGVARLEFRADTPLSQEALLKQGLTQQVSCELEGFAGACTMGSCHTGTHVLHRLTNYRNGVFLREGGFVSPAARTLHATCDQ